jgi:hypothetical protein
VYGNLFSYLLVRGRLDRDRMVVGFTTIPVQSMPITTKVLRLNPTHGEVYLIQHYVIKFVSDLWEISGFFRFPPPIKLTFTI